MYLELFLALENHASCKLICSNVTINEVVMYGQKNPTEITQIYQVVMNMTHMKGPA